jgi:hypothetical protein
MAGWKRALVGIAMIGLAVATREIRLAAFAEHQAAQRYEDVYYLPRTDLLPLLSLGFREALADLIWCKSQVYFGEELVRRGAVKYVFTYTDAVLALDPTLRAAYRWIAIAALYRPVDVTIEEGLHAASYLKRALERWPNDGQLHWEYGATLRFELAPLEKDRSRKQALVERAATHLESAARLGAGPPWLVLNNVDLLNKLGRSEQAIRQLEELHGTVQSDQVRSEIEERLRQLRAHTYLEALKATNEQFEQQRKRSYPYLSNSLFMLVGEPMDAQSYYRDLASYFEPSEAFSAGAP